MKNYFFLFSVLFLISCGKEDTIPEVDTDGDGVFDSIDLDNNTRQGVPVDENGVMLNPIYLDENGVTVKSYEWSEVGDVGKLNGTEYPIVDVQEIKSMINNNEDLSKICTSKVTDMNYLFVNSKFNGNISNWDVSNVVFMDYMFSNSQFNGDISNWDVSSVTNMGSTFSESQFNGDISNWDVSSVTGMSGMFYKSQFNGDISNWDVSSVTIMDYMFTLTPFNGDISNWDVSNVNRMKSMFHDTTLFNQDLSSWNVNGVTECLYFSRGNSEWTLPKPNFTNCTGYN